MVRYICIYHRKMSFGFFQEILDKLISKPYILKYLICFTYKDIVMVLKHVKCNGIFLMNNTRVLEVVVSDHVKGIISHSILNIPLSFCLW